MINVGFAIVPSLTSGKVDAIMGPYKNYETIALEDAGHPSDFFQLQDWGVPTYDELIFITGPKTLEKKEEAVKNFVNAIGRAIDFARANPEKALEDFFKAVPDAERTMETRAFKLTLPHFAKEQKHDPARWQKFADFAFKHGLIEKAVKTESSLKSW
jgi:putative hydroxymethylpyrimidine transport system substrate-binding protein